MHSKKNGNSLFTYKSGLNKSRTMATSGTSTPHIYADSKTHHEKDNNKATQSEMEILPKLISIEDPKHYEIEKKEFNTFKFEDKTIVIDTEMHEELKRREQERLNLNKKPRYVNDYRTFSVDARKKKIMFNKSDLDKSLPKEFKQNCPKLTKNGRVSFLCLEEIRKDYRFNNYLEKNGFTFSEPKCTITDKPVPPRTRKRKEDSESVIELEEKQSPPKKKNKEGSSTE